MLRTLALVFLLLLLAAAARGPAPGPCLACGPAGPPTPVLETPGPVPTLIGP